MEQERDQVPADHTGPEKLIVNQQGEIEDRTVIETGDRHVFRIGKLPDVPGKNGRERRPRFDRGVSFDLVPVVVKKFARKRIDVGQDRQEKNDPEEPTVLLEPFFPFGGSAPGTLLLPSF